MPTTINQGFADFLKTLTPSTTETSSATSHRASIKSCLESNFSITGFFRTGSFGNGTSISGHSDVDYFAVTPNGKLKQNSDSTLQDFRSALDKRFPNTGVRVSCPAVIIPFNDGKETTEVIPAEYLSASTKTNKFDTYDIPDCDKGWMKSAPDAHNNYVSEQDKRLNYKVKPLIRFVKAWKFFNKVKVSSFYLEMRTAKFASGESSILYTHDLRSIFRRLSDDKFPKLQDPAGIGGYIVPTYSDNFLEDAISKASTAYTRADKAITAEEAGNIKDAYYWWGLVFGGEFPTYG